jgi:hypothetical protein
MKGKISSILAMILIAAGVSGCGSGGGGGGGGTPVAAGNKATAAVRMPYAASGQPVAGLQLTINMPLGVTVQLDPVTGHAAKSVVQLSGATNPSAVLVAVDYVPATSSVKGKLKFLVVDPNGFTSSENVTVQLDITPGYFPKAGDFSIDDYIVSDIDGDTVYGLTPTFSVQIL